MDIRARTHQYRQMTNATQRAKLLRLVGMEPDAGVQSLLIEALRDPSATVRSTALHLLELRGFRDRDIILKLLNDKSKMVRRRALRMLQHWADPHLIPQVKPFLHDQELDIRLLAMDWFFVLGEAGLPYLRTLVDDPMFSVRTKARHYIQDLQRRQAMNRPLKKAAPSTPSQEVDVGVILAQLVEAEDEAVDQWSGALIRQLETPHWERREHIVQLIKTTPRFPLRVLHPALRHPLWYVRAVAVEILGTFRDPTVLEHALDLAQDANVEVRRALIEALGRYPPTEEVRFVLERLMKDPHFMIRRRAREQFHRFRSANASSSPRTAEAS